MRKDTERSSTMKQIHWALAAALVLCLLLTACSGQGTAKSTQVSQTASTAALTTEPGTEAAESTDLQTDVPTEAVTTAPAETEPAETEPLATEPTDTEPILTEPAETEAAATDPIETEPLETEPAVTEPAETEPVITEPAETEPAVTEPAQTEPAETEPAVTEPAATEPDPFGEAGDVTDRLTAADRKNLNVFMSNFSEVFFNGYDENAPEEEYDLLMFGYLHLKLNDNSKLGYDNYYYTISQADMDACLDRFFGVTVPPQDYSMYYQYEDYSYTDTIEFRNGAYYYPAADGEAYNYMTVVNRVESNGDGTFFVSFDVFDVDIEEYFDHGIDPRYYEMTPAEAFASGSLSHLDSGTALLRLVEINGRQTFQLVQYTLSEEDF